MIIKASIDVYGDICVHWLVLFALWELLVDACEAGKEETYESDNTVKKDSGMYIINGLGDWTYNIFTIGKNGGAGTADICKNSYGKAHYS